MNNRPIRVFLIGQPGSKQEFIQELREQKDNLESLTIHLDCMPYEHNGQQYSV